MSKRWRAMLGYGGTALFVQMLLVGVSDAEAQWYRGNTHTHTLHSDGDSTPDVVVRWYKDHRYQFVVITDHEYLTDVTGLNAIFGAQEKFLVIPGEEVTQMIVKPEHPTGMLQVHVNGIGISHVVHAMGSGTGIARTAPAGTTVAETIAHMTAGIRAAGGIASINHPTWLSAIKADDLTGLGDGTLLSIDPLRRGGIDDAGIRHPSSEEIWDALLSRGKRIWGVSEDDSHTFKTFDNNWDAVPGKRWVMVRAETLTPSAIKVALQKGDFYASNGVVLDDIVASPSGLGITIHTNPPVYNNATKSLWPDDTLFMTEFIGKDGRVLEVDHGHHPEYRFRGDELYVRARITDYVGKSAWVQPVFRPGALP